MRYIRLVVALLIGSAFLLSPKVTYADVNCAAVNDCKDLYLNSQTWPAVSDSFTYDLGLEFAVNNTWSGPAYVWGLRLYRVAGMAVSFSRPGYLYGTTSGVQLASCTFTGETTDAGWVYCMFATPVAATAGVHMTASYRVSGLRPGLNPDSNCGTDFNDMHNYCGHYANRVTGDPDIMPTGSFGTSTYGLDVLVSSYSGTPTPTPTTGPTATSTPTPAPTSTNTATATNTPTVTPTTTTSSSCTPDPSSGHFLEVYDRPRDTNPLNVGAVRIHTAINTYLCAWTTTGASFQFDLSGAGISLSNQYVSTDGVHGMKVDLSAMSLDTDMTVTVHDEVNIGGGQAVIAVEGYTVTTPNLGVLTVNNSCVGDALAWNPSWPCYAPPTATTTPTRTATPVPPTNTPVPPTSTSQTCTGRQPDPCYVIAPTTESLLAKIGTAIASNPFVPTPGNTPTSQSFTGGAALGTAWAGAESTIAAHFPVATQAQGMLSTAQSAFTDESVTCETWVGFSWSIPVDAQGVFWRTIAGQTIVYMDWQQFAPYWCPVWRQRLADLWLWVLGIDAFLFIIQLVKEHGK